MSKATKYILPSILFTLTSALNAGNQNDCQPDPCCTPCPPRDPCAKCAQLWPSCGPDWIITPNAGPCVTCGADVFVTAEFLYWTVRQNNTEFALTSPSVQTSETLATARGKFFNADGKMEPGFKVGLGMMFDCDGWDLYANYTWLRTKRTRHAAPSTDLLLSGTLSASINEDGLTLLTSKWEHDFNVIDLELGRNFFISQCLHLRPHFGLKGHWQEQEWTVNGTGINEDGNAFATLDKLCQDYWGVGIRAGLDSAWHFTNCFSLVGEVAASVQWQRFESTASGVSDISSSPETFEVIINAKDNFHMLNGILEMYLGLRWEDWFCCDEYHYSIEAAWEMQWWAAQNQLVRSRFPVGGGDLGLQGLTVKVRFDF